FEGLLLDLFAALFKLNIVVHDEDDVEPSAAFFRVLLDVVLATPALEAIRQRTVLDELAAGVAARLLSGRLLGLLQAERLLSRSDMLDVWNLQQQDEEQATRSNEAETAKQLVEQIGGRPAERQLREAYRRLHREAEAMQRRVSQRAAQMRASYTDMAAR